MKTIILDGVEIIMEKKHVKNINISVKQARVHISVPEYVSYAEAEGFAREKLPWIKKSLERMKDVAPPVNKELCSGDSVTILGKEYKLEIFYSERKKAAVLTDATLFLYSKDNTAQKALDEYSRSLLGEILPPLIDGWEKYMGVKSSGYKLRRMKTRWGVCNIATHEICFNTALAEKSPECIEYIVVHELCHLIEPSHNARFKSLMDSFLPDWRERKKSLNFFKEN